MLWDYIVVGGGLSGSVITSRLLQYNTPLKILLIEAGEDVRNIQDILYVNDTDLVGNSDYDWLSSTVSQPNLYNHTISMNQGKGLGGGTIINSCGWTRGASVDYDEWAEIVGDGRWGYESLLPYFKLTEDWWNSHSTAQHGTHGALYVASVSSTGRRYPLRQPVADGWDSLGVKSLPCYDGNAGQPIGRAELTENRRDGLRQIAASYYKLDGASLLLNTLVEKLVFSPSNFTTPRVSGIQLENGTVINAHNVIVSAGAIRSPQLLLLSGIGPQGELEALNITTVLNNMAVGQNLIDHLSLYQYWKLSDPDAGYALGSNNTLFDEPQFQTGYPIDWSVVTTVPKGGLIRAITADEGVVPNVTTHPVLESQRAFIENFVIYEAYKASDPAIPLDGSYIYTNMVSFQPTSRGHVRLQSTDPKDQLYIDPNYLATEVDRYVYREAVRQLTRLMLDSSFAPYIDGEAPPDEFARGVSLNDTDEYLDARVAYSATTTWHPHGTLAMGSVVDTNFRVVGVDNLFVVDSSVIPNALGAHLQAPLYAMSERAAVIISELHRAERG